jgi:hypothetical protein
MKNLISIVKNLISTVKNLISIVKNFYPLLSIYFLSDYIPALLLFIYINYFLYNLLYILGISNFIIFSSIILGCFFYLFFYEKLKKRYPKICFILSIIFIIIILITLAIITATTAYAQSPEPEDLNALYKEFIIRKSKFNYDFDTLTSKAKQAERYFNNMVDKVEYSKSTGNCNLITIDIGPEGKKVFENILHNMTEEIYKDSRTLAEELPKLQIINSRLTKAGAPLDFDDKHYNDINSSILHYTSKD